ncbi:hypothetical protein SRHO_G00029230 [Serrasalmus rhombeus]
MVIRCVVSISAQVAQRRNVIVCCGALQDWVFSSLHWKQEQLGDTNKSPRLWLLFTVWSVKLEQEVEKNKILSEALQTLATERHRLKQALSKDRESPTPSTLTEDEFYDALTGWLLDSCVISFLSVSGLFHR